MSALVIERCVSVIATKMPYQGHKTFSRNALPQKRTWDVFLTQIAAEFESANYRLALEDKQDCREG